jgi:3-mercaptopropionate dioxygenase
MTSALGHFIDALDTLLARESGEERIVDGAAALLATLVATDDWLPDAQAQPDPARYRQYLLHLDPAGRYSVVSFVWGPGQSTPIHDHRVWGLVGVLRGAERDQRFARVADGGIRPNGAPAFLLPGSVARLSPSDGDIHQVSNVFDDQVSISIHVYGGDIGTIRRATFDATGTEKPFISAYADVPPPVVIRA